MPRVGAESLEAVIPRVSRGIHEHKITTALKKQILQLRYACAE